MKITQQVTLYFIIVLLSVSAGVGFMFNRIHVMDVAHRRLAQEWEELGIMASFLNDINELMTDISLSPEGRLSETHYLNRMERLAQELEDIRLESVRSEDFEEEKHVNQEKGDFIRIYGEFQGFIQIMNTMGQASGPSGGGEVKNLVLKQLSRLRSAGVRLQAFYIKGMGEASDYAQKTRRQIRERMVIVSLSFLVFLAGMAFWFIYLVGKNTQAMLDREKNMTIGLLARSLSHEIRNPLGIIKSSASVIRKKLPPDSEEYEITGYLAEEADRIDNLIDQLLQLRTEPAGNMTREDPAGMIQQVIMLLTGVCQKAEVTIDFVNEVPDRNILCDRNQIKQVLINLILNAIEFSPPRDAVHLSARIENNRYCVDIQDNGPGFQVKDTSRVFQPFYTTKKNGSGLGLFVAKKMIESNGGSISIDAGPSKGGIVRIYLQLA